MLLFLLATRGINSPANNKRKTPRMEGFMMKHEKEITRKGGREQTE